MRLGFLILLGLSLACAGGTDGEKAVDADPVVTVETTVVALADMPDRLRLTGEVTAAMEALVAADTNGTVTAILVERGQHVKKGDTLLTVDTRTASLAAQAGKAFLATAIASFTSAVEASDTEAVCSPIAGLKTGAVRPLPATSWPPMKKGMVLAMGSPPELVACYAPSNSAQQWTGLRF